MMHPLHGPRLKIRRAESHIKALRAADEDFRKHAHYRVIPAELDPKIDKYALRILVNVLPPLDLGLCIGEAAHDLRSALDGLVYQLGKLNSASEEALTRTQFPIFLKGKLVGCRGKCRDRRHFHCRGREMIAPLRREHQAAIERLQPYKRGNRGDRNPLYLLQEINNADKHRLLQVLGGKLSGYGISGWGDPPDLPDYHIELGNVFEDGAQVGYVAATDIGKVRADQIVAPFIAFWQGCPKLRGAGVCYWLMQMAEQVSEIVECFGPEFD